MSNADEVREYGKKHLLAHLKETGHSDQEIEAQILEIPMWSNLRVHFARQFAESLPAEEQAAALRRLMPHYDEGTVKITVLTVAGEPVMYVSANLLAPQVDLIVRRCFGVQKNHSRHNWRGDPVSNDDVTG